MCMAPGMAENRIITGRLRRFEENGNGADLSTVDDILEKEAQVK
jgi:hypothetical protein